MDPKADERIPRIETEHLVLRGQEIQDLDASAAMWANPDVVRFIDGRPFSREEVWAKLLRNLGHWSLMGFGFWAVIEKQSGRFVGEVGMGDFQRDIEPPLEAPEAGWVLAPWSHGRGFATESVRAALGWLDTRLGVPRTVCMIDPNNHASIRVAEKCGYQQYERATYKGQAMLLFKR